MALPPALAARLAKRGILNAAAQKVGAETEPQPTHNEEIIAEDYDSRPGERREDNVFWEGIDGVSVDPIKGHPGCPNKCNVYHECSTFCVKRWRKGKIVPDDIYLQCKDTLLQKYPLPNGWHEVYDTGCGQHYYWNRYNNVVSWLPPSHPKSVVSESASHLREERLLKEGDESDDSSEGSDQEVPQKPKRTKREPKWREERERRVKVKANDLDPMDPAAYGDIARGAWSAGLETGPTGVDSTAAGPLYQARPYPNPGAVLAANRSKQTSD